MYDKQLSIRVRAQSLRDGGRSVHLTVPVGQRSSVGFGVNVPGELVEHVRRSLCAFVHAACLQPHRLAARPGAVVQSVEQFPPVEVEGWRFRRAQRDDDIGYGIYPATQVYPYLQPEVGIAGLQAAGGILGTLGPLLSMIPGAGPALAAGAGALGQALGSLGGPTPAQQAAAAQQVSSGASAVQAALAAAARNSPSVQAAERQAAAAAGAPSPALAASGPLPNLAAALGSGVQGAPALAGADVLGQALNTLLSVDSLRSQLEPEVARTLATALRAMETTAGAQLGNARAREVLRAARLQTANEVARGLQLARLITAP